VIALGPPDGVTGESRRARPHTRRPLGRPAIDDEQRFAILRCLLHDRELDPRDRFAGSVLLLYGKPMTRIVALRTADIHTTPDGEITLRLGAVTLGLSMCV
jgi:hypothetical protein